MKRLLDVTTVRRNGTLHVCWKYDDTQCVRYIAQVLSPAIQTNEWDSDEDDEDDYEPNDGDEDVIHVGSMTLESLT